MPPTDVRISIPDRSLGRDEVVFTVGDPGELLGTLTLSAGHIEWYSKPRLSGRRMSWQEFGDIMEHEPTSD